MKITTLFIDRDGVINADSPDYIKRPEEFHFLPGSQNAFALIQHLGLQAMVITNQSVIGRGWVTPEGLEAIFDKMRAGIDETGGRLDDIFFCPHTPGDGCNCRKPKTGMVDDACQAHGIEVKESVFIGDSAKDILCGKAAGCARTVLVLTGNGHKAREELKEKGMEPHYVAPTLLDAVKWVAEEAGLSYP